jgi:hypothetical protein
MSKENPASKTLKPANDQVIKKAGSFTPGFFAEKADWLFDTRFL